LGTGQLLGKTLAQINIKVTTDIRQNRLWLGPFGMVEEKLSSLGISEKQPICKVLINKKGKSPITGLVEDIGL
jgi:hypothetical protein